MNEDGYIFELFLLKCAALKADMSPIIDEFGSGPENSSTSLDLDLMIRSYISQIDLEVRKNAVKMAEYYKIFYMLENFIRDFISEVMEAESGPEWWGTAVPEAVRDTAKKARDRELSMGVTPRSATMIEYITFGELGEIIKANSKIFGGIFPNLRGLESVMGRLNTVRGPIMHCGSLADDEVLRLKLSIRDWFKLSEGK